MITAKNADRYNELYEQLQAMNCPADLTYSDQNWHNMQEQWVQFHVLKHSCFSERTKNRLESLNQKLKTVIVKYSTLPTFFSTLMACIGSINIEKTIKSSEAVIKKPTTATAYTDYDKQYQNLLTPFAFCAYKKQSTLAGAVQFIDIDQQMAVSGPAHARVLTRGVNCDCSFFTSMGIICKHMLAFRQRNALDMFEPPCCLERWNIGNQQAANK